MQDKLLIQIKELEHKIKTEDITAIAITTKEWGGADVIIKREIDANDEKWLKDQETVISFQKTLPKRRLVITEYSKELSWLFKQLGGIFADQIDYLSKYDFYGTLAQSAIEYFANNTESKDMKSLLLYVLDAAKRFDGV